MANISWCPDTYSAAKAWNTRVFGWIPCSKRTPENAGEPFIVSAKNRYGQNAVFIAFQGYGDFKWHTMDIGYMDHTKPGEEVSKAWEITHWMPLPAPPEMNGGCNENHTDDD